MLAPRTRAWSNPQVLKRGSRTGFEPTALPQAPKPPPEIRAPLEHVIARTIEPLAWVELSRGVERAFWCQFLSTASTADAWRRMAFGKPIKPSDGETLDSLVPGAKAVPLTPGLQTLQSSLFFWH